MTSVQRYNYEINPTPKLQDIEPAQHNNVSSTRHNLNRIQERSDKLR